MSLAGPFVATIQGYRHTAGTLTAGDSNGVTPMRATISCLCSNEPSLAEVLDDPMILAVMARDGIGRAEMIELVHAVQQKLGRRDEKSSVWR